MPERKKKILFLTDPTFLKTGLSRNITALLKYLWATNKYELVHVCCGTIANAPELQIPPWECYGVLPNNQQQLNELQKDGTRMRLASYGLAAIDDIIKEEKPDIFVGSNDSWSFHQLPEREWFQKINSILHVTLDSLPIKIDQQNQAAACKNYFTWTSFAEKELKRIDAKKFGHVKTLHGTLNSEVFKPTSLEQKRALKKQFGISEDTMIVTMVSRNQLRKLFFSLIEGLVKFKKWHPGKKVKLLFNTTNEQWQFGEIIYHLQYKEGYEGILKPDDVLFGYFCKNCKQIDIKPLIGNDLDCRMCGAQKSQIIPSINMCADEDELVKKIYGISDCMCHCHTSGGLEWSCVEGMLCGLPLATIPYSCGTEFTENNFVYSIDYTKTREVESGFWKAVPDDSSVAKYYNKMFEYGPIKRMEIGMKSREWAVKEFDVKNIGPEWEDVFDKLPLIDYSAISFNYKKKLESYELKNDISDDKEWVRDLYKNVLLIDVNDSDKGLQDWCNGLKQGQKRQDILNFFLNVAKQDNQKNKQVDFGEILEGKKEDRVLLVQPETMGDELLITSLLKDYETQYPDKIRYLACKPQFAAVFLGIPDLKVINWEPWMDNSLHMEANYFQVVLQAHPFTQRFINYLHNDSSKTAIDLNYKNEVV